MSRDRDGRRDAAASADRAMDRGGDEGRHGGLGRRSLLRAGVAASLGAAALPLTPRRARAGASRPAPASRVLILSFYGGMRSSAAFAASPETAFNPWGLRPVDGLEYGLGAVLTGGALEGGEPPPESYDLGAAWNGARVSSLVEVAPSMSVVGSYNEGRGDHLTSQIEETTGARSPDQSGIVTRIGAALAGGDPSAVAVPAFQLQPAALFGAADAASTSFAPVQLAGPQVLPSEVVVDPALLRRAAHDGSSRFSPSEEARARFDRRFLLGLGGPPRALGETHSAMRTLARRFGRLLSDPLLNTANAGDAFRTAVLGEVRLDDGSALPLTNAMLVELFTRAYGPRPDDPERRQPLSELDVFAFPYVMDLYNASLAVRLLQSGASTVAVEMLNFDYHSGERASAPHHYATTGRILASLHWLLSRIPEPTDPSLRMIDRTLVVGVSEFGRDPNFNATGWNSGEGSDHGAHPATWYFGHPVFGAGVPGGRWIAPVGTTGASAYDPRHTAPVPGTQRFLSTLLAAVGADHEDPIFGFPESGGPILELWGA